MEISLDYGLVDLVAQRFDAGVRLGGDMIAVRNAAEIPVAVVGAPSFFARQVPPITSQSLVDHATGKAGR